MPIAFLLSMLTFLFFFLFFAILGGFSLDHGFLTKHLLLAVLMVQLLNVDLSAKLFEVLMRLFKNLKKTGVLLGVDHVDICIKIVIFERLDSVSLVFVLHHLLFLLFGLE